MMQNNKYIGQGYVIDYLLQYFLKDKQLQVISIDNQNNTGKLNFIVKASDNGKSLGVHVTINSDDSKMAAFVKRKADMLLAADKALYLHINLTLHDNSYIVVKNSINDVDDTVAYEVSPYGMQKQDLTRIMSYITDYKNNLNERVKNIDELEGDPLEASIVRIKGKLIVVELEGGSTHVGVVDYDATNKEAILEEMNNAETNMYGRLENNIRVLVKMEPNKEPGRPDMARIIALR